MKFRPPAQASARRFAGMSVLAVTLLLTQLAGPLVHMTCLEGPEGHLAGMSSGVVLLNELDASTAESGHHAQDCAVCRSLTQSRDEFLVEPIQYAAPAVTVGTAPLSDPHTAAPRLALTEHSPRGPPLAG